MLIDQELNKSISGHSVQVDEALLCKGNNSIKLIFYIFINLFDSVRGSTSGYDYWTTASERLIFKILLQKELEALEKTLTFSKSVLKVLF